MNDDATGITEKVHATDNDVTDITEKVHAMDNDATGITEKVHAMNDDVTGITEKVHAMNNNVTGITEKIHAAIQSFEERVALIETNLENEMQKHYKERKTLLLDFLYKEKVRYDFALAEFKKLLDA